MIFCFSGTGNSNYVAKRIADALGDEIVNLNDRIKVSDTSPVEIGERVIIVTPTYAWRIPRVVRDWLLKTELRGTKQAWFVMTCGGEIGNANKYNRELCTEKTISCMGTAQYRDAQARFGCEFTAKVDAEHTAARFVTSWATAPEAVQEALDAL